MLLSPSLSLWNRNKEAGRPVVTAMDGRQAKKAHKTVAVAYSLLFLHCESHLIQVEKENSGVTGRQPQLACCVSA